MTDQFGREIKLIVGNDDDTGLDLSEFKISFRIEQSDLESPNAARIKVYNLKRETVTRVEKEFKRVCLDAGYDGNFGTIFLGTIKQTRAGREMGDNTNTYVEILAAEGDLEYCFGQVNLTVANATPRRQVEALAGAMGLPLGYIPDLPFQALARDKVLYGMANLQARYLAKSLNCRWSIQNGKFNLIPDSGYVLTSQSVVKINSETGMIGVPEVTQDGIRIKTLLNPKLVIGQIIEVNNRDVTGALLGGGLLYFDGRLEDLPGFLPKVPRGDGLYRIMVSETHGDTRANDWYSDLTCLSVERAPASAAAPVKAGA